MRHLQDKQKKVSGANRNESAAKLELQVTQLVIDSRSPNNYGNIGFGTASQKLFAHLIREGSFEDMRAINEACGDQKQHKMLHEYQKEVLGSTCKIQVVN